MSKPVHIEPEADAELREAYTWYERARVGLGDDFLLCFEAATPSSGAIERDSF